MSMLIEFSLLIRILHPPALFKLLKMSTRLSGLCALMLGICPGLTIVLEPAESVEIDWLVASLDGIFGGDVIRFVVHFFAALVVEVHR